MIDLQPKTDRATALSLDVESLSDVLQPLEGISSYETMYDCLGEDVLLSLLTIWTSGTREPGVPTLVQCTARSKHHVHSDR